MKPLFPLFFPVCLVLSGKGSPLDYPHESAGFSGSQAFLTKSAGEEKNNPDSGPTAAGDGWQVGRSVEITSELSDGVETPNEVPETLKAELRELGKQAGEVDAAGRDWPAVVDLDVGGFAALGTAVPHLVEHAGRLHVFWRGPVEKQTKQMPGLPMIPNDLAGGSWKEGWNTVAYACRRDGGTWSGAARLVDGDVRCDPNFVWSDGRGLNLLVEYGDGAGSHLLLGPDQKTWREIRRFPEPRDGVFVPLGIAQAGDSLHAATFSGERLCYWRYDGRDWHGPIVIENEVRFDGTWGFYRPRLAVTDAGDAHVVWNTQAEPTHVVIRNDGMVSKNAIPLTPRACKGDHLDLEALAGGRLILAYRVAEEEPAAGKNAIHTCLYVDGRWGGSSAGPAGGGTVFGSPQMVAYDGEVLLVWEHLGESGSTASFSIRNRAGWWSGPAAIQSRPHEFGGGPSFYNLYCTKDGNPHLAWGNGSVFTMALPKLGATPGGIGQDGGAGRRQPAAGDEDSR